MTDKPKVAVVTGANSPIGLGNAICRFLARDGADIAIWDRDIADTGPLIDEIRAMGRRAIACQVDVSDRASVNAAAEQVRAELGPVGILVNNAGISPEKKFVELTEADWDQVFNINTKGMFLCTQAVIHDMLDAQWGRIVNISSSSAQTGSPRLVHYAASKGGVIGFTKGLAREMAPHGITVNNVPPGSVYTAGFQYVDNAERFPDGLAAWAKANIPVQHVGRPEDIANAVAFLASEASGYITGHTLSVNGGRYMS